MFEKLKQYVLRKIMGADYGFTVIGDYRVVRRVGKSMNSFWVQVSNGPLGTRIYFTQNSRIYLKTPLVFEDGGFRKYFEFINVKGGTSIYYRLKLFENGNLKCRESQKTLKDLLEYTPFAQMISSTDNQFLLTEETVRECSLLK